MTNVTFLCFLLLPVSLAPVTSQPTETLNNIADLKGIDFGHKYPRHGLHLLYWFSHEFISFDNNNNMKPEMDPKNGAFGFHRYRNMEDLLPSLRNQKDYAYYTVGNLLSSENLPKGERLPDYVTKQFHASKNSNLRGQNNRDRIIVRRNPHGNIDQVYITEHYDFSTGSSDYDPNHTYRVASQFIKDLGNMKMGDFLKYFPGRGGSRSAEAQSDSLFTISRGNIILPSFLGFFVFQLFLDIGF